MKLVPDIIDYYELLFKTETNPNNGSNMAEQNNINKHLLRSPLLKLHGERNQRLKRRLYRRLKLRLLIVVQNDENRRLKRRNRRLKPRYVSSDETTMDHGLKRLCSYALLNKRRGLIRECKSIVVSNDDDRRFEATIFFVSVDDEVVVLNYDALSSFQTPIFLSV